jgi:hypothetical protein
VLGQWVEGGEDYFSFLTATTPPRTAGQRLTLVEMAARFLIQSCANVADAIPDYRRRAERASHVGEQLKAFLDDFKTWGCPDPLVRAVRHGHGILDQVTGEVSQAPAALIQAEAAWASRQQERADRLRDAITTLEGISQDESRFYGGAEEASIAPRVATRPEIGKAGQPWVTDICRFLRSHEMPWRQIEKLLRGFADEERLRPWFDCDLRAENLRDRLKPKRAPSRRKNDRA